MSIQRNGVFNPIQSIDNLIQDYIKLMINSSGPPRGMSVRLNAEREFWLAVSGGGMFYLIIGGFVMAAESSE